MLPIKSQLGEISTSVEKNREDINGCIENLSKLKDKKDDDKFVNINDEIEKQLKNVNRIHVVGGKTKDEILDLLKEITGRVITPIWITQPRITNDDGTDVDDF